MVGAGDPGGFTAVGMGSALQMALRGDADALAMPSLAGFSFSSSSSRRSALQAQLQAMHGRDTAVCGAARQALANADYLAARQPGQVPVENGAVYPTGNFGNQLKEVAQLVKCAMGLRVACVDLDGFDHHDTINTRLPPLLDVLARGLAAFHQDLGTRMGGVTLVTISEFGRRVAENASAGTDHGCGSLMLLLGGGVLGGRVYADWPGLAPARLFNGDLDVTLDYRTVLTELMAKRMAAPGAEQVFPDVAGLPMAGCFSSRRAQPEFLRRRPTLQPSAPLT
jgi:uncharacterized protein (DUF1501 family)